MGSSHAIAFSLAARRLAALLLTEMRMMFCTDGDRS
ncbi:hypothetical protein PC116_g27151 [Phytophthora cactorum]|nr:hypothetical protein PC120_g24938 [Phytophthora cactorum]KAG3138417.1 hypothetical protein PC128_g25569 [Phytophthora cactorum]KAG4224396.1 hypothetical protein PC116_g27151 [Phytophthora cactorum]